MNTLEDEENVGVDRVDGSDIAVRIAVSGRRRRFEKRVEVAAQPGCAIRLSLNFPGCDSAFRVLAYVDPQTGKAVVRSGEFRVSDTDKRGHEVGTQLVWESDVTIWRKE